MKRLFRYNMALFLALALLLSACGLASATEERGYTPAPGDLIFFDWQPDGQVDHVGIVERVEGGYVHTIEGNSSDSVRQRSHPLDSTRVFGCDVPLPFR